MKIALINETFSSRGGGRERYAQELAGGLLEAGCDVHLVGCSFADVPAGAVTHAVHPLRRPKWLRLLDFSRCVRQLLQHEHFDITYTLTQTYPSDLAFLASGVHQHWMHLRHPYVVPRTLANLLRPVHLANLYLESRMFGPHMPRQIIASSHLVEQQLIHYYQVPPERIIVIHHGADARIYNLEARQRYRAEQRQALGLQPDDVALLHVSHNWKRKGVPTILRALRDLGAAGQAYRVVVVGQGQPAPYRQWAARNGLKDRVLFPGPAAHIERFYAAADLFVLPTVYDPFALVCVEAMACGLPVITTAAAGASELITPGINGLVLNEAHDHVTLAGHLRDLLDKDRRTALGTAAAATAAQLTHHGNIDRTVEVCQQLQRG